MNAKPLLMRGPSYGRRSRTDKRKDRRGHYFACRGEKATCKVGGDDGEPPMIRLTFETIYSDGVWSFLGRNCGSYVELEFHDAQLSLGATVTKLGDGGGLRPV